jgi:predicted RNA-binding protein with PIN domain
MRVLLIDGYNLIHSHQRLSGLVERDADAARQGLLRELSPLESSDYYRLVIVVFDAAGSRQTEPVVEKRQGIQVVFTRRGQTADSFIEAAVRQLAPECEVQVATSDNTLANVASGFGAIRIDGASLFQIAQEAQRETRDELERMSQDGRVPLEERVSDETRRLLNKLRFQ